MAMAAERAAGLLFDARVGQRGILHPFLAAWTANLIALFFAFWRLIPLLLRRE